jgi:hypothetical protein
MQRRRLIVVGAALLLAAVAVSGAAWYGSQAIRAQVSADVFRGSDTLCVGIRSAGRTGSPVELASGGRSTEALRAAGILDDKLKLTDLGWEQLDLEDEGCLVAGKFALSVVGVSLERFLKNPAFNPPWKTIDMKMRARARVDKLAPWVSSPAIHDGIPEIRAALDGIRGQVTLIRTESGWRALAPREFAAALRVPASGASVVDAEDKDLLAIHPHPDKRALTKLFLEEHADWVGAKACIQIAGSSPYPVDERPNFPFDDRLKREQFAVAVYEMPERDAAQQNVIVRTLPRLEALERAGVLVSSATFGPRDRPQWRGRLYTLAPEQEQFFQGRFGSGCLYAGRAEMQVTGVKYRGASGKIIVQDRYKQLAPWARSPQLIEALPDLGKVLESGVVCQLEVLLIDHSGWKLGNGGCF